MNESTNEPKYHDDKYLVFKKEEFLEEIAGLDMESNLLHIALPDAVVIRLKDRFAAGALNVYAHILLSAASVMDKKPKKQARLRAIANHFMTAAEVSMDMHTTLPD